MKKITLILLCFCAVSLSSAQSISKSVISAAGSSGSGTWGSLDYTFGEVVIATGLVSTNSITQGFHQPTVANTDAISEVKLSTHFTFYPNPATDLVKISTDLVEGKIQFFNSLGQTVFERNQIPNQVDVSDFPTGIYTVMVTSNGIRHTGKIQIQ